MNFCANRFFFTSTYAAIKESARKRKKLFDYRFFFEEQRDEKFEATFRGWLATSIIQRAAIQAGRIGRLSSLLQGRRESWSRLVDWKVNRKRIYTKHHDGYGYVSWTKRKGKKKYWKAHRNESRIPRAIPRQSFSKQDRSIDRSIEGDPSWRIEWRKRNEVTSKWMLTRETDRLGATGGWKRLRIHGEWEKHVVFSTLFPHLFSLKNVLTTREHDFPR